MAMGLHLDVLSAIETVASKVHSLWQSSAVDMNTAAALAQELRECFQQVLVSVVGLIALYRDCDEGLVRKWIFELRANYIRKHILLNDAETHSAPAMHLQKLREMVKVCNDSLLTAHVDIMGTLAHVLTIRGLPVLRDVAVEPFLEEVKFALEMPATAVRDLRNIDGLGFQPLFLLREIARLLLCLDREDISYPLSPESIKLDTDGNVYFVRSVYVVSTSTESEFQRDVWLFGCVVFYVYSGGVHIHNGHESEYEHLRCKHKIQHSRTTKHRAGILIPSMLKRHIPSEQSIHCHQYPAAEHMSKQYTTT
eukprot:TRINITY_DN2120_c0_g1_i5.p1 TRINITY_DN2120_c0_g1~~TRINITY_DN2120_c0_g1_i5.p1  ORF type:complete len:321 (+),score=56.51 TRINITY_DN2120_c0_g1_i5:38-964(+)